MEDDKKEVGSDNMMEMVDLATNLDNVLKYLREKDVITEEEEKEVTEQDVPFNKKSTLIWILKKKDESAMAHFKEALLQSNDNTSTMNHHIEPEVTVVQSTPSTQEPDQEGMALAVEIEKEFDRIQSGMDDEQDLHKEEEENYDQQQISSGGGDLVPAVEEELESDVRVEITAPTESEPEMEGDKEDDYNEEPEIEVKPKAEEIEVQSPEIVEPSLSPSPEPEPPTITASEAPRKQVTFGEVSQPAPKEFVLHDDNDREGSESPSSDMKSIVAMNREKFEKSNGTSGGSGGGATVKYSFAKKGGVAAAAPKEEEPKESTVKNLRNFFQKLGSIDAEEGSVLKRGGVRPAGNQNRRTMI